MACRTRPSILSFRPTPKLRRPENGQPDCRIRFRPQGSERKAENLKCVWLQDVEVYSDRPEGGVC